MPPLLGQQLPAEETVWDADQISRFERSLESLRIIAQEAIKEGDPALDLASTQLELYWIIDPESELSTWKALCRWHGPVAPSARVDRLVELLDRARLHLKLRWWASLRPWPQFQRLPFPTSSDPPSIDSFCVC